MESSDRIQKKALLRAPIERVWGAISDSSQFGRWFGVEFDAPFVSGAHLVGKIVPTAVDSEAAKQQEPYAGRTFEISIAKIEPNRLFSFRWHPFAVDPEVDYSKESTTLIEFALEEAPGGTMLTITESGFDRIPLHRRAKALEMNEHGWTAQLKLIEKYVTESRNLGNAALTKAR